MKTVQTVTGPCAPSELGTTLMHEHLMIGWPGWEAEAPADRAARREHAKRCVDRMLELRDLGLATFLDPCPIDLGRDVELMAEVAQATGVRIVCATGLYKEDQGAPAYFKFRAQFGDGVKEMTDVFIRELTEGVGETGIRAGVIKVATSAHKITPYEEIVLRAAARAHRETGRPAILPPELMPDWQPTHVFKKVSPRLRAAGVSPEKITTMLVENPRRYFAESGVVRA